MHGRTVRSLVFLIALPILALLHAGCAPPESADLPVHEDLAAVGFSAEKLEAAHAYQDSVGDCIAAAVILYQGKVLAAWGDTAIAYKSHSVRKGLLSSLYGIHVAAGAIDTASTLAELGIDDIQPLTDAEKQARVVHLLKARSGVYHPAAAENAAMKSRRPERGSHEPDSNYYYNNWDFNVLGTIFEQETGTTIFAEFAERIAGPVGMQDFDPDACFYHYERELSEHPSYTFRISTRDRARFGLLYLQGGRWKGEQVVDESWVDWCMARHSLYSERIGGIYVGVMWGLLEKEAQVYDVVSAYEPFEQLRKHDFHMLTGHGGQMIALVKDLDLVVALSGNTEQQEPSCGVESLVLVEMVLEAMVD